MTGSLHSRHNVLGVLVNAATYESATESIMEAARSGRALSVTALAVHGVMTGVLDRQHRYRLNHLDLVLPDGQPVRWALNLLHGTRLRDRVYGPALTGHVLAAAAANHIPVYFFGSTEHTLGHLTTKVAMRYPGLVIAGSTASSFRTLSKEENVALMSRIKDSGARIVFVGIGCPRQEVWAFENSNTLSMPVIAVGAAFDFHAGTLAQAPPWMQKHGLEWVYRLFKEPRRLWRRYLYLNPSYVALLALQRMGLWKPRPDTGIQPGDSLRYG